MAILQLTVALNDAMKRHGLAIVSCTVNAVMLMFRYGGTFGVEVCNGVYSDSAPRGVCSMTSTVVVHEIETRSRRRAPLASTSSMRFSMDVS